MYFQLSPQQVSFCPFLLHVYSNESLCPSDPSQDVIEFRPKYRPMLFELRVFPHDHSGDYEKPYATPEMLIAQDTLVSEVVELLCNSA